MKAAYIQPFYKATRDVFRIMMDVEVKIKSRLVCKFLSYQ